MYLTLVSPKQTKIIVIRLAINTTFYMNQNEQYVFKVYACFLEQREKFFSGTLQVQALLLHVVFIF